MLRPDELSGEATRRNLEGFENDVAATIRGYRELTESEWKRIENTLLRLLLDVATLDPENHPAPDGLADIPLSLLSRALANSARSDSHYLTGYLKSLASVACAVAGNFPTAGVFARGRLADGQELGPFEQWSMSVLADPRMMTLGEEPLESLGVYPRTELDALVSGQSEDFRRANAAFAVAANIGAQTFQSSDALLLMLWSHVRARFRELSVARILGAVNVDSRYIKELLKASLLLYPPQAQAIERNGLLNPEHNALIVLPTSTGKSLLGELALVNSLSDAKPIGVYLAPYRALADQVFQRMRLRLTQVGIACDVRRGGYLSDSSISGDRRTVVVATPESFDAFLRVHPLLRDKIACAVFDEFHLIEQQGRGLTYEGLVGRLRSTQTRIVALSPVLAVSPELAQWLDINGDDVVSSAWHPTARRLAIARPDRRMTYFTPDDRMAGRGIDPVWSGDIPFPHRLEAPIRFQELQAHGLRLLDNVASVAIDQFHRLGELPVLVLSSTREQTRVLAYTVCRRLPEVADGHPLRDLAREVIKRTPYLLTLHKCLKHGVAYHNASLPNWIRERLEALMSQQAFRIVVATTTLAEGVDLPFRVVVMADWQQWQFGKRKPMPSLLFRNIAGRCGRAGAFAEGDTIIVDNPGRIIGGAPFSLRYQDYLRLYIQPQPQSLCSSVESALEFRASREGLVALAAGATTPLTDIDAALESQFSAFVGLCQPAEGQEEDEFVRSLFSGRFPTAAMHIDSVARSLVADTLTEPVFAVMARSSPLRLTDFGQIVLATGLSPRSGMAMGRFLRAYSPPSEPRKGRVERHRFKIQWDPFIAALVEQCQGAPNVFVSELRSGAYQRVGNRGFPVNHTNFLNVVLAWFSGVPVEEIAVLTVRNKDVRIAAEAWVRVAVGELPAGYEEQIEQVSAFLTGYVSQQWSWVLRAISSVGKHVGQFDTTNSEILAIRAEYGVRHAISAYILAAGCIVDRAKVDKIVTLFCEANPSQQTESSLLDWLEAHHAETSFGFEALGGQLIDPSDVDKIKEILQLRR